MDIFTIIQTAWDAFAQSYFFLALKIFFGLYSVVLILDIILILSFRDLDAMARQRKFGTALVPSLSKKAFQKEWSKIETYLQDGNPDHLKLAVLHADDVVAGVLHDTGYTGNDMAQQLEQFHRVQPQDAETLEKSHQIRNDIVLDDQFVLTQESAQETIEGYKNYLKKFDFFG